MIIDVANCQFRFYFEILGYLDDEEIPYNVLEEVDIAADSWPCVIDVSDDTAVLLKLKFGYDQS